MNRSFVRGLGLAAIGASVAIAASNRAARRADQGFREASERVEPVVDDLPIRSPFVYHRCDGFTALHSASFRDVAESIPSATLHPVRLRDGRAVVFVGAYDYREYTYRDLQGVVRMGPPYAEVMIAALVTPRPMPPVIPLALGAAGLGGLEAFVLHLPVTARVARDVGRRWWGLPKFVADMDFVDDIASRGLTLGDRGAEILRLTVRSGGLHLAERQAMALYSAHEGRLLRTMTRSIQSGDYRFGGSAGELTIGDGHPVADDLRRLDIAPRPLLTETLRSVRLLLPRGVPVGEARPYRGFEGAAREFGRFTVRYPGTGPLDLYEDRRAVEARATEVVRQAVPDEEHALTPA